MPVRRGITRATSILVNGDPAKHPFSAEIEKESALALSFERKAESCTKVTKAVVGIYVLPTRLLFADGILRRLPLHVSVAKPISAPLRF